MVFLKILYKKEAQSLNGGVLAVSSGLWEIYSHNKISFDDPIWPGMGEHKISQNKIFWIWENV